MTMRSRPHLGYDPLARHAVPAPSESGEDYNSPPLPASYASTSAVIHQRVLPCTAFALLAACASVAQHSKNQQMQLQQYLQYAEAPVDSFTYLGHFDDWRALSDTQLVVWTTFNEPYLITVRPPCINLQFAQHIGLTSTSGTVSNHLDSVILEHQRCQITQIRPVDYQKMQAELRKNKQQ